MKFVCAFVLLLAIGAVARVAPSEPPSTKVSCSAFAALKIRTVGTAKCKGLANANCIAVASAYDDFQEAYDTWFAQGNLCQSTKLEFAAKAVARACASVYAQTLAKVKCVGAGGFACGFAISEGEAFAQATAKAVAQAAVDASTVDSDAFCVSDVEAIAGAVAEAAASSQSAACVTGTGSEVDFQAAFVKSVAKAIATAYVKATAATCDVSGATAAASSCYGEAEGKTIGDVKSASTDKGDTHGSFGSLELCHSGLQHCCHSSYKKVVCTCEEDECLGKWNLGAGKSWVKGSERCICSGK